MATVTLLGQLLLAITPTVTSSLKEVHKNFKIDDQNTVRWTLELKSERSSCGSYQHPCVMENSWQG